MIHLSNSKSHWWTLIVVRVINVGLMITYDDDPDGFIRSLYRPEFGWRIDAVPVVYESENRADRSRTELIIMNYDPIPLGPLADNRKSLRLKDRIAGNSLHRRQVLLLSFVP